MQIVLNKLIKKLERVLRKTFPLGYTIFLYVYFFRYTYMPVIM